MLEPLNVRIASPPASVYGRPARYADRHVHLLPPEPPGPVLRAARRAQAHWRSWLTRRARATAATPASVVAPAAAVVTSLEKADCQGC